MTKLPALAMALAALFFSPARAQESGHVHMSPEQIRLPEACETAAGPEPMSSVKPDMQADAMPHGQGLDAVQQSNMDAMMQMHAPMQRAVRIKNPDLAFNCGMIAHHFGAIAMAEAELERGRDEMSKAMAKTIIEVQKREIEDMKARIEAISRETGSGADGTPQP